MSPLLRWFQDLVATRSIRGRRRAPSRHRSNPLGMEPLEARKLLVVGEFALFSNEPDDSGADGFVRYAAEQDTLFIRLTDELPIEFLNFDVRGNGQRLTFLSSEPLPFDFETNLDDAVEFIGPSGFDASSGTNEPTLEYRITDVSARVEIRTEFDDLLTTSQTQILTFLQVSSGDLLETFSFAELEGPHVEIRTSQDGGLLVGQEVTFTIEADNLV